VAWPERLNRDYAHFFDVGIITIGLILRSTLGSLLRGLRSEDPLCGTFGGKERSKYTTDLLTRTLRFVPGEPSHIGLDVEAGG